MVAVSMRFCFEEIATKGSHMVIKLHTGPGIAVPEEFL